MSKTSPVLTAGNHSALGSSTVCCSNEKASVQLKGMKTVEPDSERCLAVSGGDYHPQTTDGVENR